MESQHYDTLSAPAHRILAVLALIATLATAAAEEPEVLITSCDDVSLFTAGRTPDNAGFEFSAWDIQVFDGAAVAGSSLRWHVHPSSERQSHARLAWALPLEEPLSAISLWVKNPNDHGIDLSIELIDADGATYRSEGVDLGEERDWRRLTFRSADLEALTADPFPPLTFPVVRFSILLEGLDANRPHTIYLDQITGHAPEAAELQVERLRVPTALAPGEPISVRATLQAPNVADRARLVAELTTGEGALIDAAPLRLTAGGAGPAEATAALRVPDWLPPGRYQVALRCDDAVLTGEGARPVPLVIGGSRRSTASVSLAVDADGPAFVIGDRRMPAAIQELRGAPATALSDRTRVVAVPATTDTHPFGWAAEVVDSDEGLDFTSLDRRIAAVLKTVPDAAIVLQIYLDSSSEWDAAFPEELQQFGGAPLAPPDLFAGRRSRPDILSPLWQRHALSRLRALIAYTLEAPWSDRVIGYELQAGDLGAWRPWGSSAGIGDETGELRQRLFRLWTRDHYEDVRKLRASWLGRRRGFGAPGMSFDAVEIPRPLADAPEPSLYDPAIDQPMIDLQHFRAEATADLLLAAARVVREEAGPTAIIGAPYGHLLSQARANDWKWPHLALTRCLDSGALNFLTGPLHRHDDQSLPSFPVASSLRAGIAYFERTPPADDALAPVMAHPDDTPTGDAVVVEVIDDMSARYLSGDGELPRELLTRPISGQIPHRLHLTRDLIGRDPPRASVYVFRNLFVISPEDGRSLARNTARDGSLLVWVYAPGAVSRHLLTGRTMEYLTGLKLTHLARHGRLRVEPAERGLRPFGFDAAVSPWFISADERAEWLGSLAGVEGDLCGLALRNFGHCTSVFSAAPPTEEVLRHLARIARVELPDGDATSLY